jgi:hypothetical protein
MRQQCVRTFKGTGSLAGQSPPAGLSLAAHLSAFRTCTGRRDVHPVGVAVKRVPSRSTSCARACPAPALCSVALVALGPDHDARAIALRRHRFPVRAASAASPRPLRPAPAFFAPARRRRRSRAGPRRGAASRRRRRPRRGRRSHSRNSRRSSPGVAWARARRELRAASPDRATHTRGAVVDLGSVHARGSPWARLSGKCSPPPSHPLPQIRAVRRPSASVCVPLGSWSRASRARVPRSAPPCAAVVDLGRSARRGSHACRRTRGGISRVLHPRAAPSSISGRGTTLRGPRRLPVGPALTIRAVGRRRL